MATFIKLTRTYQAGKETKTQPVVIDSERISSIRPRNVPEESERVTRTTLKVDGGYINVAEKFSDVCKLLENAGSDFIGTDD